MLCRANIQRKLHPSLPSWEINHASPIINLASNARLLPIPMAAGPCRGIYSLPKDSLLEISIPKYRSLVSPTGLSVTHQRFLAWKFSAGLASIRGIPSTCPYAVSMQIADQNGSGSELGNFHFNTRLAAGLPSSGRLEHEATLQSMVKPTHH